MEVEPLPGVPATPSNTQAIRQMRQQAVTHAAQAPALHFLIEKLANAAIGGLTEAFLGNNGAAQLEAAMAAKVEEARATRKRTTLPMHVVLQARNCFKD